MFAWYSQGPLFNPQHHKRERERKKSKPGEVVHTWSIILALARQRQEDHCKPKASLISSIEIQNKGGGEHKDLVSWFKSTTSALGRLRQEDCHEFEVTSGYRVRLPQKNPKSLGIQPSGWAFAWCVWSPVPTRKASKMWGYKVHRTQTWLLWNIPCY